jgi:hypothetical protein
MAFRPEQIPRNTSSSSVGDFPQDVLDVFTGPIFLEDMGDRLQFST